MYETAVSAIFFTKIISFIYKLLEVRCAEYAEREGHRQIKPKLYAYLATLSC